MHRLLQQVRHDGTVDDTLMLFEQPHEDFLLVANGRRHDALLRGRELVEVFGLALHGRTNGAIDELLHLFATGGNNFFSVVIIVMIKTVGRITVSSKAEFFVRDGVGQRVDADKDHVFLRALGKAVFGQGFVVERANGHVLVH